MLLTSMVCSMPLQMVAIFTGSVKNSKINNKLLTLVDLARLEI
jgi:hypothetical protein